MNFSTQSFQEIVIQELAELSETQQEDVLSFIYSLKRKKPLTPQDKAVQEVSSTSSAQSGSRSRRLRGTKQSRAKPQKAPCKRQSDEPLTLIALKQFPEEKQQRLNFLAEKNTEGSITKEERFELEWLVDEEQSLMLQNTETLARSIRPDFFDKQARPIKRLITQPAHQSGYKAEGKQ